MNRLLVPLSQSLPNELPGFVHEFLEENLDFVFLDTDGAYIYKVGDSFESSQKLVFLFFDEAGNPKELIFKTPFINGSYIKILGQSKDFIELRTTLKSQPKSIRLDELDLSLFLPPNIAQEYERTSTGTWRKKESNSGIIEDGLFVTFRSGLEVSLDGGFSFDTSKLFEEGIRPFMVGKTGVIIDVDNSIKLISNPLPNDLEASIKENVPLGFEGIWISNATISYFKPDSLLKLPEIQLKNSAIGSGGFTGTISAGEFAKREEDFSESDLVPTAQLPPYLSWQGSTVGNKKIIFQYINISLEQSIPSSSLITGHLFAPLAEKWLKFKASMGGANGDFMLDIGGAMGEALLNLENDYFKIIIESIAYKVDDGVNYAIISGGLQCKIPELDIPLIKVDRIIVSENGDIDIEGGWVDLEEQKVLDFYGFPMELTEFGMGNEGEGANKRQWIGFSGELSIMDSIPIKGSVEGLKFSWIKGQSDSLKVSIEGIGVDFTIPDTIEIKGEVAFRKRDNTREFIGEVEVNIITLKTKVTGELKIKKHYGTNPYTSFFIDLKAEIGKPIPLGSTGLGIYGFLGLFALNQTPLKNEDEKWGDWYDKTGRNVKNRKYWEPKKDNYGFGLGVIIGTMGDGGYSIRANALLVLNIPGPIIILEGTAEFLKDKKPKNTNGELKQNDPSNPEAKTGNFSALVVFDGRQGTFEMAIAAQYNKPGVVHIDANLEAFFDFHDSMNWYLNIGRKEPEEKRIRAKVINLFKANAYLMIAPVGVRLGAAAVFKIDEKYGPVKVYAEAGLGFDMDIFWKPYYLYGLIYIKGRAGVKVFGFGLGLEVALELQGKAPSPYHLIGEGTFKVSVPWPFKDPRFTAGFEWGNNGIIQKEEKLVLEAGFVHPKSSDFSTIASTIEDGDLPIVPVDSIPYLKLARPSNILVGKNQITDKIDSFDGNEFDYSITKLELTKLDTNEIIGPDIWNCSPLNEKGNEPQEPIYKLWENYPNDTNTQWENEDFANNENPCPIETEKERVIKVNWFEERDREVFSSSYEKKRVRFISNEVFIVSTFSSSQKMLHNRNHKISIIPPKKAFKVIIEFYVFSSFTPSYNAFDSYSGKPLIIKESNDFGPGKLMRNIKIEIIGKNPSIELTDGWDGNERTYQFRGFYIKEVTYHLNVSSITSSASTTGSGTSQNPGSEDFPFLKLEPNSEYRITAHTNCEEKEQSFYFRTDSGPGIDDTIEDYKYLNDLSKYIDSTIPANGGVDHYYKEKAIILFNEPYVKELYESSLYIKIFDRNGNALKIEIEGSFTNMIQGDYLNSNIPLLNSGALTSYLLKEKGECGEEEYPNLPMITFKLPELKANRLYFVKVYHSKKELYKFQFTTSKYSSWKEHILISKHEVIGDELHLKPIEVSTNYGASSPPIEVQYVATFNSSVIGYSNQLNTVYGNKTTINQLTHLRNFHEILDTIDYTSNRLFEEITNKIFTPEDNSLKGKIFFSTKKVDWFSIKMDNGKNVLLLQSAIPLKPSHLEAQIRVKGTATWTLVDMIFDKSKRAAYFKEREGGVFFDNGIFEIKLSYSLNSSLADGYPLLEKGTLQKSTEELIFNIEFKP